LRQPTDEAQTPFGGAAAIHELAELCWATINAGRGRYPI
jgi:hypothetical protein